MLISHKYKFIFIRNVKTAGTSIEIELSRLMSDEDIVTEIKPAYEDHKPRNQIYKGHKFFNHMSAKNIKDIIGENIFKKYFKFCVEREPVDKCVSYFSMFKNSPHHKSEISDMTWNEFLSSNLLPIDYLKYTDGKKMIIDKILKYENLDDELKLELNKLGIKFEKLKVKAKSNYREQIKISHAEKVKIYKAFELSNKFTGYHL